MPIRDGQIVNWKIKIESFARIVGNRDMSSLDKVNRLADIIEQHESVFSKDGDRFAEDLRDIAARYGNDDDEDDLEEEGNIVLSQIYNYADENLIWLGMP